MPAIEIRPAMLVDLPVLVGIEHSFDTSFTWQMDRNMDAGQVMISFREIRLPRSVHVEYPRPLDFFGEDGFQNSIILTALWSGTPLGYLRLKEEMEPRTVLVKDLAVKKDVRRQGIASVLLLAAQDWAFQRSLKRVLIEVQSKNVAAIHLATKLGYEFCGYNDHYYANQDIALFFARYLR